MTIVLDFEKGSFLTPKSIFQDISVAVREVERWKEEVKVQEAKACVAASRLKTEVDAHRETKENLEKTIKHLAETREEIESTRKECADFMKKIRDEEKEASAKLIIDAAAASEMETLRDKYNAAIEENNSLSVRIYNEFIIVAILLESKSMYN